MQTIEITPELIDEHGLSEEEYQTLLTILKREPNLTELGIFSVMWSEHCSYKNSRPTLSKFPTEGPQVLMGPGENAGVVDIGNGLACCFKMESHNHPSAVMPYAGAATGVGGILRDIFTMGARPIAMLDSLRFGLPDSPRMQFLINGVVDGIADYGNCVGVPTVAGDVVYENCYEQNILVNAMCAGLMKHEDLTTAQATGKGNLIIYFGNATGRDGIHGATFASEELTDETIEQRSAVQVGDPFMGKKILEATLELIQKKTVIGIQDMGAAGLTCSTCEMAGRAGTGVTIDLDKVPQRAENMSAYELMLSESQERMLAVCTPEQYESAKEILEKWQVGCHLLGEVDDSGLMRVMHRGEIVAEIPAAEISVEAPVNHREQEVPDYIAKIPSWETVDISAMDPATELKDLLAWPTIASKRWIYQQFDHMVQLNTVVRPGGDAAVLRVKDTDTGLALTSDCNSLFCYLDPNDGGKIAVAEAARNIVCSGGKPLAITNCLNFGNPLKPANFWQFDQAVMGVADACRELDTPVTGGNVSLYNESKGLAIFPTPMIGMVGLVEKLEHATTANFKNEGDAIYVVGPAPKALGGSQLLRSKQLTGKLEGELPYGPCPSIDLAVEKNVQQTVLTAIQNGLVASAHDVSDGGLAVTVAESCIVGENKIGAAIEIKNYENAVVELFSEDVSRIVVSIPQDKITDFEKLVAEKNTEIFNLGTVGGTELIVKDLFEIPLSELNNCYNTKPF